MDVSDILEARAVSKRQNVIVAIAVSILILDAADLQLLSFVSPVMIGEWKVTKGIFGIALSSALFSMAIGAFVGGWFGDRFGRKKALLAMVLLFGVGSVLTAFATSVTSLTIIRLISGFGFGAASPNALALATEWMPLRLRGRVASLVYIGTGGGTVVAGLLATFFLSTAGWQGCFIACGAITLVVAVLLLIFVPESAQFLQLKGRLDAASAALARVFSEKVFAGALTPMERTQEKAGESILGPAYRRFTIGTCFSFMAQSSFFYALGAWLPIILLSFGFTLAASIQGLLILSVIATIGGLVVEPVIRRYGSKTTMLGFLAFNIVMTTIMIALSVVNRDASGMVSAALVLGIIYATSFAQAALASGEYIIISHGYPLSSRAAGFGANLMCSRLAGMGGISMGGYLLGLGEHDSIPYFSMNLILLLLFVASIFVIDRHVRPREKKVVAVASENAAAR